MLIPKLFETLKDYSAEKLSKDAAAGLIVGIVSLPLAIAFAIASGATPDKGLYTAIIAGFIVSAFGGSRVQIGGPTGAFVIIVYGIIQRFGYDGLLISAIMAGIILVIFGVLRLGSVIKFIPYSVVIGFTFGIAVLIFIGQIPDFMGLGLTNLPADVVEKLAMMVRNLNKFNPYAFGLAAFTILAIWLSGKITSRIPGSLFAILLASAAAYALGLPVETIGSRFGELPHSLPFPSLPIVDLHIIRGLLRPAFTIAMLGAIESLLSAVVADGMIGGRHDSNMELVAQGVANIVTPFFGAIYKFKEALEEISNPPSVLILKFTHVPFIDSTGVNALTEALKLFRRSGTKFIFCGVQPQVMSRLQHGGIVKAVGRENFHGGLKSAVARAHALS